MLGASQPSAVPPRTGFSAHLGQRGQSGDRAGRGDFDGALKLGYERLRVDQAAEDEVAQHHADRHLVARVQRDPQQQEPQLVGDVDRKQDRDQVPVDRPCRTDVEVGGRDGR